MNPNDIKQIIDQFSISIFPILVKAVIFYSFYYIIKSVAENISSHIIFKTNPFVSIGRNVTVNSFNGKIEKITLFYIIVSNDTEKYYIQMKDWKAQTWIFK